MGRKTTGEDVQAVYREIGANIREIREKKPLKQQDLADIVALTRTSITNIESGRQKVLVHTLLNVARALEVPVQRLLPKPPVELETGYIPGSSEFSPEAVAFLTSGVASAKKTPNRPSEKRK
jgi:transcriptional regulator with XRE-family HTH domain